MTKYHIRERDAGGCARAATGLSVGVADFHRLLASDKCEVCRRRSTYVRDNAEHRRQLAYELSGNGTCARCGAPRDFDNHKPDGCRDPDCPHVDHYAEFNL